MTKLILISGKAESGKTTVAKIIKDKLESEGKAVTILPFASYLKFLCSTHFGWDGRKDEKGREILQYVGTDIVRKKNPDFWVKTVADFIETFGDNFDYIISDDVRFPNEIDYFRDVAITDFLSIRITRLDHQDSLTPEQKNHLSEISLDDYPFDIYISSVSGYDALKDNVEYSLFIEYRSIREWFS